jgi:thioredoxin-dependent peroxiredoxin
MPKTPQVGEPAPDFELAGTDGPFKLSDHLGERVVLLFYPGDETMVCTKQFCSYRDRGGDFASLNASVVGISSQDLASHEQFVAKHGLNVPLLADVDKEVAESYGASSKRLGIKRAVVIVDEQDVVRYRHDHLLGLDYQSVDDLKSGAGQSPERVGHDVASLVTGLFTSLVLLRTGAGVDSVLAARMARGPL